MDAARTLWGKTPVHPETKRVKRKVKTEGRSQTWQEESQRSDHRRCRKRSAASLALTQKIKYGWFVPWHCHLLGNSYQPGTPGEEERSAAHRRGL